jgi:hypothetical protein
MTGISLAIIMLPQEKASSQWIQWMEIIRIQVNSIVQTLSISCPDRVLTTKSHSDYFYNHISGVWAEKQQWYQHFGLISASNLPKLRFNLHRTSAKLTAQLRLHIIP